MSLHWPRAVLFDLDGTLADTAPDLAEAIDRTMQDRGLEACGIERVRGWIGAGIEKLVERALTYRLGRPPEAGELDEFIEIFKQHYDETNGQRSRLYPGVAEGLRLLQQAGVALACVTNKASRFTLPLLARLDVHDFFGAITCGDQLPDKKPHPLALQHTVSRLGVTIGEALLVGDSATDVETARNAGMTVICVTYGYSGERDVSTFEADALIDSVADLPRLIQATPSPL